MKKLLIFLLGAGAGSAITWYITKETYRRIADEEIASVIDKFKEREDELKGIPDENPNPNYRESNEDVSQPNKVVDINSFKQINEDEGYTADDNEENYIVETEQPVIPSPYEVSIEEYNEDNGYLQKTLMYTADNLLLDEDDNLIVDPTSVIGLNLDNFSEYEDTMYVRDDYNKIDFVIIRSEKTYRELSPEEE